MLGLQGENKGLFVCKKKMGTSTEELCTNLHKSFKEFAEAAMSLRFEDEPRYEAYQALFEPLLYGATSSEKCISIDPSLKVTQFTSAFLRLWGVSCPGEKRQGLVKKRWLVCYSLTRSCSQNRAGPR